MDQFKFRMIENKIMRTEIDYTLTYEDNYIELTIDCEYFGFEVERDEDIDNVIRRINNKIKEFE